MRSSLLYLVEAWVLCTVVGLCVLAPLRQRFRDLWLPATPAVGVAFLVAGLHWTSLVWGTARGVWLVLVAAAVLAVLGVMRGTRPWRVSPSALGATALTSAIGLAGAALALVPNLQLGSSRVVLPTPNHDAFYYISEAVWLTDHPYTQVPAIASGPGSGTESPLGTSMVQALALPLRIGQPLASSAIHAVFGSTDGLAFMPTMAAWVLIAAGAVFVGVRLLGGSPVAGAVAAALVCVGGTTARAAYDTHADSLLGIALVVAAIAAFVAATVRGLPRWPAVVLTTGIVGVYSEYLVFVLPAMAAAAFLTPGRGYLARVRRGVLTGILSVLLSPAAWFRAVKSMVQSNPGGDTFPSPFLTADPLLAVARALGSASVSDPRYPVLVTGVAVVVVGVGAVAALVLSRFRAPIGALLLVGVAVCGYASATGRGYLQDRVVTLTMPLLWVIAVLGWDLALRRLGIVRRPVRRWVGAGVAVGLTAVLCTVNASSASAALDPDLARSRLVSGEFDEAAGWVRELGGPEGRDVTVAVPDLFDQMWMLYELRDEEEVSFLSLHQDYLRPEIYWNGEVDRYIVVGAGVVLTNEAAVVRRSEHFKLVDTAAAPVTVIAPTEMSTWWAFPDRGGALGGTGSGLVLLHGPGARTAVSLRLQTETPGVALQMVSETGGTTTTTLGSGETSAQVPDTPGPTERVTWQTPGTTSVRTIRLVGASSP